MGNLRFHKVIRMLGGVLAGLLTTGLISVPVSAGNADDLKLPCRNHEAYDFRCENMLDYNADGDSCGVFSAFVGLKTEPEVTVEVRTSPADGLDFSLAGPALDEKGKEYVVTLGEGTANLSKVSYSILMSVGDGGYAVMLDQMPVTPDKQGILHLKRDPVVIALKTQEECTPWPVTYAGSEKRYDLLQAVGTKFMRGGILPGADRRAELRQASITLRMAEGSNRITVWEAVDPDTGETVGDTVLYDVEAVVPTWNEQGELLPIASWRNGKDAIREMQWQEEELSFTTCPVSDFTDEFYYVITLEDADGKVHVTTPVKISPKRGDEIVSVETEQGALTFRLYWDHAILLSYEGTDELLEVPGRVMDTPVTEVAAYAFSGLKRGGKKESAAREVVLPAGVRRIDSLAFYHCLYLEEVTFPTTVESIGAWAFAGCLSLENVELPKRVHNVGAYAFTECAKLKSAVLPSGIRTMGDGVFACCDSLEEIQMKGGSTVKVVDGALYADKGKRLVAVLACCQGEFAVPKGTKVIGADCFSDSSLTSIILPEGLETISNYAFYGTKNLRWTPLPESLLSVGDHVFDGDEPAEGAEEETRILIGKKLSHVGRRAFGGIIPKYFEVDSENAYFSSKEGALLNKEGDVLIEPHACGLQVMTVPEGVREVDLSSLETSGGMRLYLPQSVTVLRGGTRQKDGLVLCCGRGSKAEEYGRELGIAISYEGDALWREYVIPTKKGELTYRVNAGRAILVHYEGADEELEIPALIAGVPVKEIGNGRESIMGGFAEKTLRGMKLPDTIEVIGAHAFECFGDFEVNLPGELRSLGDHALFGCSLKLPGLPEHLEYVGAKAFGAGVSFEGEINLPGSIMEIEPGAFYGVSAQGFRMEASENALYVVKEGMLYSGDGKTLLSAKRPGPDGKITVPEGTKVIGAYAFSGMDLREAALPESLESIEEYAFAYCGSLKALQLPEGLLRIGDHAFVYTGLEEVILPKHFKTVETAAFFGASELKSVSGSAEKIESYAFAYCGRLEEIKLGEGLLEIGDHAFYDTAVAGIRLPDSLCTLGAYAFSRNDEGVKPAVMHEFYVGKDLAFIGEDALSSLPISDFKVHEENQSFQVTDRLLTDHAGRRLIACPAGISGSVTVPEGIFEVAAYAFYGADSVTDVFLPDSVCLIGENAFYDHAGSALEWKQERAKLHFLSGTAAHAFAVGHNWPFALTDKDEDGMM